MFKRISTVGGLTMVSRIFGFVRDMLMARYLGAGMAADAFFIAFKLPNFFRRLFAEGAFSAAFVPMFSRILGKHPTQKDKKKAIEFAESIFAIFLPVLFVFLVLMEVGMAQVMLALTGGFDGNEVKFELTTHLARMTFPYLLLISLVSLWAGMLNAFGRFSAAAFAPVLLNIFMITALLMTPPDQISKAKALAASISLAGLGQFFWLMWAAKNAGITIRLPRPRINDDVKQLLLIIGPAALGAGAMQLNLLIDIILAAHFLEEGAISWLFYADRLNQLPVGVVGVAIGTVLLPSISRLLGSDDHAGAMEQQNKAIQFALLLTIPAAVALAIIPHELIATLFERAAFSASDTDKTAFALVAFASGLPAYVLTKTLMPGYFARKDTKTPVKFGLITLVVNTGLNLLLIGPYGHAGLAMGTAIAAWVNVMLLYAGLRSRGHLKLTETTRSMAYKALAAAAVMGVILDHVAELSQFYFIGDGIERIIALGVLIVVGLFSYFIVAVALKAVNPRSFRKLTG